MIEVGFDNKHGLLNAGAEPCKIYLGKEEAGFVTNVTNEYIYAFINDDIFLKFILNSPIVDTDISTLTIRGDSDKVSSNYRC